MAGYKVFQSNDILTAADFMTFIMKQTVMRFASTSARDSSLIDGTVREGMVVAIAADAGAAYLQVNKNATTTGWETIATQPYVATQLNAAQRPLISLWMNEGL